MQPIEGILKYDSHPSKILAHKKSLSIFNKKNQNEVIKFHDLVLLPNIIGDKDYLSRKKTFDVFLRKFDTDFLKMHINKNSYEKNLKKIENKDKDKNYMFSNELWSETYYKEIIDGSYIKDKCDKIINEVKLRKYDSKIKITDEYYRRKHKSFHSKKSIPNSLYFQEDEKTLYQRKYFNNDEKIDFSEYNILKTINSERKNVKSETLHSFIPFSIVIFL